MASSSASGSLAKDDSKWYFTSEQLANSPSRKCGMDADQELMYRQRAANLIQDMGQRLQVSQLCINTAIVYMHRFYAFHSFTHFHRNNIAAAALFLAAKVEEQPRKLEHIIKVVHICLGLEAPDPLKESYAEQAQDLVFNENVLLQTLGFDVAIDHPHTHVVKTCHLVKASKDLAQTSYFMASNSLHLTTMCLQYKPTVVACFCIHLACKWSRWEIPQSNEGRHWFHYVDKSVTLDLLKQLTDEFLHIFDRCPTRLKSKMKSIRADQAQSDDAGRRSASSSSGMSGSSSVLRGIDDAGSSSSSHHRSSSHSQHSHSKQSSSGGDPMLKASQSSSSSNSKPSSSSSSSSRSRDRPSSSSSQQQQLQHNQQQTLTSSSGHYGSSAVIGKMQQPAQHHGSSRSGVPSQSSSSSSARTSYMHEGSRDPKNRMMSGVANSSSSLQMNPYTQNKLDRHSNQKNQSMPHVEGKSAVKSQSSMVASLFNNSSDMSSRMPSSSSMMKQPQAPYGSHPPSYSQSMSGRNNMPSSESTSVPNQQQQQQQQQQQYKNQLQQLSTGSESSFRLIDDSNRLADPMQICTPPKQSKPSSIFSPDWKDTQVENNNSNVASTVSTSSSGNKGRSQAHPAGIVKPIKESPSSREKKPVLPLFSDQQQSQQHKQRSETPKKERRSDTTMTSSGNQQKSAEKKTATSSSATLKRSLESTQPVNNIHTGSTIHSVDQLGINKLPNTNQAPMKRTLPSSDQIRHDDGTDFRESKVRKLEVPSPSDQLFASTFDLANTFDKQDDGFSLFSFNDPGSLLSQPLLSDSKPINTSSKTSFSSTVNGIETNPALVSSLLKESLCSNESKFGTLTSSSSNNSAVVTNASIATTASSSVTGSSSFLLSMPSFSIASSASNTSTSSVVNQTLKVPDTIKNEPASIDANAPATISGVLFEPASSLPSTTSTVSATVSTMPSSVVSASAIASDIQTLTGDILTAPSKDDEHYRSKSEKKKKKDKHKHKEKDKSKDKDREERKKHKKDKDRHRDREREKSSVPTEDVPVTAPIKIKLPKDKLNLPSLSDNPDVSANQSSIFSYSSVSGIPPSSDTGLKIKIPKDRLSGSSSLGAPVTTGMGAGSSSVGASYPALSTPNPLKLKISKDKIISTGSSDNSHNNGSGHGHVTGNSGTVVHHGHSGKKKDRERDRDKNKSGKSSMATASVDYTKHNGNNSGSSAGSGGSSGNSTNKSNSSKIVQQQQYSTYNANSQAAASQVSLPNHPASFDYMQHAQAPTLQQQQQYFNQFGTFNVQQQQQTMINSSAMKTSGGNAATVLPYYYNSSNQNNGSNSSKK